MVALSRSRPDLLPQILHDMRVPFVVALAYFVCAAGAFAFTRLSGHVPLLWVANAPLIAALLTRPVQERRWHIVGCFAAGIAAMLLFSPYRLQVPIFGVATIAEGVLTWALLRRLGCDAGVLLSLPGLRRFLAAAGVIAPIVTGMVPAVTIALEQGAHPGAVWVSWAISHGLGALICTPLALLAMAGPLYREPMARSGAGAKLFFIAAILIAVTGASFAQHHLPLMFLPVLPLITATMSFRVAGAALGVFLIALVGAGYGMAGQGPVRSVPGDSGFQLLFFQFYLAVLFLIAMPFATLITQINRLIAQITASEARYRMISDHVSDVVLTMDARGHVQFASPSARELTGHDPDRLIGRRPDELVHASEVDRARAFHAKVVANPDTIHRFEFRGNTPDGGTRWFEATARAVPDAEGGVASVVSVVREISQRKAREADLVRQATTDPMTGVLNRRAFHERIEQVRRVTPDHPATLALFDLDHFKQVNDRHGHAAGDAALLHFTDVLRANLRGEDAIARLGGEEFAVLFPGLAPAEALHAVERVRAALERTRVVSGTAQFSITVSAGLAPMRDAMSGDEVLRIADLALYRAKAMGRNRSELAAA